MWQEGRRGAVAVTSMGVTCVFVVVFAGMFVIMVVTGRAFFFRWRNNWLHGQHLDAHAAHGLFNGLPPNPRAVVGHECQASGVVDAGVQHAIQLAQHIGQRRGGIGHAHMAERDLLMTILIGDLGPGLQCQLLKLIQRDEIGVVVQA